MKYFIGFLFLILAAPLFSQDTDQKDPVIPDYIDSAVMKMPDRELRGSKFAGYLISENNPRKAKYYYDLLIRDYADLPSTKKALRHYDIAANSVVKVGRQVPPFEISLLGGKGKISDKSMLGKYYLLHFWASWLGCSVAEIPEMNEVYKKYHEKNGFEIISFSFDTAESVIAPFYEKNWKLAERWRMPWLLAYVHGVSNVDSTFKSDLDLYDSDIGKKFELLNFPERILVGPDGKILAKHEDLSFTHFKEVLSRYFDDGN